jgi:hypothetical protein
MFDPAILIACTGLVLYIALDNYRYAGAQSA